MAGYLNEFGNWFNDTFWGGAATKAANVQLDAGKQAQSMLSDYYNGNKEKGITGAAQYQQPMYEVGMGNMQTLNRNVNSGAYNAPYSAYIAPEFKYQQSPDYQYQLEQGLGAVQNSAAARGQGLSGATMKALQRYGTNLAAQDYNNQFNRYTNERNFGANQNQLNYENQQGQLNNQYNRMAGLADMGIAAAGNLGNMANQYAGNQVSILGNMANAQASGITGKANAQAGTVNAGLNLIGTALPFIFPGKSPKV